MSPDGTLDSQALTRRIAAAMYAPGLPGDESAPVLARAVLVPDKSPEVDGRNYGGVLDLVQHTGPLLVGWWLWDQNIEEITAILGDRYVDVTIRPTSSFMWRIWEITWSQAEAIPDKTGGSDLPYFLASPTPGWILVGESGWHCLWLYPEINEWTNRQLG